jgi:hypothetical protein
MTVEEKPLGSLTARAVVVLHARAPGQLGFGHLDFQVRSHRGAPFFFGAACLLNGKERGCSTGIPIFF